jgi:putative oxidoreductase
MERGVKNMLDELRSKYKDIPYTAFRVVFGILFVMHGLMKFGIGSKLEYSKIELMMKIAAPIEVIGGVLIILGLWTSIAAFIMSGEMAVAFWTVHAKSGLNPVTNGGELAVQFCFAFLAICFIGGGKYSIDAKM